MNKQEIEKGISFYDKEQAILVRVIRKHGALTERKFDEVFRRKAKKIRPGKARAFHRDAIMLSSWTDWHLYLDLLQHMALIDKINIEKTDSGMIYTLAT